MYVCMKHDEITPNVVIYFVCERIGCPKTILFPFVRNSRNIFEISTGLLFIFINGKLTSLSSINTRIF